ncbi:hypothetical protein BDQ12DRAFT_670885 [Crucibulum laeve]|uniref:Uncharacterized protein n=1 Tax=Crucibulum laeve TaxID=68775 RepID=A0A5C3LIX5_9AGAR|nr:hypothetical protein BDQ12DRAFT_670885 [Crucibulum laeve]
MPPVCPVHCVTLPPLFPILFAFPALLNTVHTHPLCLSASLYTCQLLFVPYPLVSLCSSITLSSLPPWWSSGCMVVNIHDHSSTARKRLLLLLPYSTSSLYYAFSLNLRHSVRLIKTIDGWAVSISDRHTLTEQSFSPSLSRRSALHQFATHKLENAEPASGISRGWSNVGIRGNYVTRTRLAHVPSSLSPPQLSRVPRHQSHPQIAETVLSIELSRLVEICTNKVGRVTEAIDSDRKNKEHGWRNEDGNVKD